MMHGDEQAHPPLLQRCREQRESMIANQIAARGVRDPRVLDSFRAVPREEFVPEQIRHAAYEDRALPIGNEQTISQPYIVAYMTKQLAVQPDQDVLEIGTGSGYQAAILSHLARHVVSVERLESLARQAQARFQHLAITNVYTVVADGTMGLPCRHRFDRIIVTAAAPEIPRSLTDQLADGGRMIVPVGGEQSQTIVCVRRDSATIREAYLLPCRFVKLLGEQGWKA